MIVVQPASKVLLDTFPASLTVSDMQLGDQYRVIVTDSHLVVLEDGPKGPQVSVEYPYTQFTEVSKSSWVVTTEDENYQIDRVYHCGCGSRLRGVHPFAGVPYMPRYNLKA